MQTNAADACTACRDAHDGTRGTPGLLITREQRLSQCAHSVRAMGGSKEAALQQGLWAGPRVRRRCARLKTLNTSAGAGVAVVLVVIARALRIGDRTKQREQAQNDNGRRRECSCRVGGRAYLPDVDEE